MLLLLMTKAECMGGGGIRYLQLPTPVFVTYASRDSHCFEPVAFERMSTGAWHHHDTRIGGLVAFTCIVPVLCNVPDTTTCVHFCSVSSVTELDWSRDCWADTHKARHDLSP